MATGSNDRRIAILAIQPRFANAIFCGQKKVEFRRVRFRKEVTHIVVYASSPICKIIGYFEVSAIIEKEPIILWKLFKSVGCINKDEFFAYFASRPTGLAIKVGKFTRFKNPLPLRKIDDDLIPPQNFSYLNPEQFRKVIKRKSHDCA